MFTDQLYNFIVLICIVYNSQPSTEVGLQNLQLKITYIHYICLYKYYTYIIYIHIIYYDGIIFIYYKHLLPVLYIGLFKSFYYYYWIYLNFR